MAIDITLNEEHHDGFHFVGFETLRENLREVVDRAKKRDVVPYVVFSALEAKGEHLPYFLNRPKTMFGTMHQGTLLNVIPKLFRDPKTQAVIKSTSEGLLQDANLREQAYREYDSEIRGCSLADDIDLVELLYAGSNPKAIKDLGAIRAVAQHQGMPTFDRVALGHTYIVGRQFDPQIYFKPEEAEQGVAKRNAQSEYTGLGLHLQERVFRALLDYGQYFEDRYRDLKEIFPSSSA